MKQHLHTLINLLQKSDLKALLQHYIHSTEQENTEQLGFMFQQSEIKASTSDYFQQLATAFIEAKGLPKTLIKRISTHKTLNFFTPALQLKTNFEAKDDTQQNVLHYLFSNNNKLSTAQHPPFNYLRSMMLFGSNNSLRDALCQRNEKNFTPLECYLFGNTNLTPLLTHELSAFLALIEIENKQQPVKHDNYPQLISSVKKQLQKQATVPYETIEHILLIATYYSKSIQDVQTDIQST